MIDHVGLKVSDYEKSLIAEFEKYLPHTPPWK